MGQFLDMLSSRGKGANSTYRPTAGTVCLVSGPHCDDATGYTFAAMEILRADATFVLYGAPNFWPNLAKWDHVICKPILSESR